MNAGEDQERSVELRTIGFVLLVWTACALAVGFGFGLAFALAAW